MTYGCIKFIDSYRFLLSGFEQIVEILDEDDLKTLKKESPDHWEISGEKPAYPYESFIKSEDYQKPVAILRKDDFFSDLKNSCPDGGEIDRSKQIVKIFDIKNGEELTRLYMKTDIILLVDVFEN